MYRDDGMRIRLTQAATRGDGECVLRTGDSPGTPTVAGTPVVRGIGRSGLGTLLVGAVLIVVSASGCSPNDHQINEFLHHWEASVSAADYVVEPPDVLEISASQAPELDGEQQIVRQDGKISLRLIGEVKVSGMTPAEISRKLESLLGKYYVNPKVNVRVGKQGTKKYYVFGQVRRRGPFRYTGRNTLLDALAMAQPTYAAWKSQIKVIHPSHIESERYVITIDSDKMMKKGNLEQNVLLQAGDIVYVPPTPIAWLAERLMELVGPMAPVGHALGAPGEMVDGVSDTSDAFTGEWP